MYQKSAFVRNDYPYITYNKLTGTTEIPKMSLDELSKGNENNKQF